MASDTTYSPADVRRIFGDKREITRAIGFFYLDGWRAQFPAGVVSFEDILITDPEGKRTFVGRELGPDSEDEVRDMANDFCNNLRTYSGNIKELLASMDKKYNQARG